MKKLFCMVILVLFALPVVANTPIKKEVEKPGKEFNTLSKEIVISSEKADNVVTDDVQCVKNMKILGPCVHVTLSCGLSGGVCGDDFWHIMHLIWYAEDMHCNFD